MPGSGLTVDCPFNRRGKCYADERIFNGEADPLDCKRLYPEVAREGVRLDIGQKLRIVYPNGDEQIVSSPTKALRAFADWLGLSQADIAERTGLSRSYVNRILMGDRPPDSHLLGLFGVSLDLKPDEMEATTQLAARAAFEGKTVNND